MSEINVKGRSLMLVNQKQKRQLREFIGRDRLVMDKYYELLESNLSYEKLLLEMQQLIELDGDFLDPYLITAKILFFQQKDEEAKLLLREAYERAMLQIVDCKGRWPKKMHWGHLENRHIMRAIEQYGILCWETGNIEEALDIFRRLLRAHPNDNQGVRFNILAIRLGQNAQEWEDPFEVERDGEVIGLDAIKMYKWFSKNAKNFPDEFQWLLEIYEKEK